MIQQQHCQLDPAVLNGHTVHSLLNMGLSLFAVLCGRNRGAFVLPHNNATYSCLELPPQFASHLDASIEMGTSNDIQNELTAGNITGHQAMELLQQLTTAVFDSTADRTEDPAACNLNGLSKLTCFDDSDDNGKPSSWLPDGRTVRGATVAGLFVPFLEWPSVLSTNTMSEEDDIDLWYTAQDFDDMAAAGLNTAVIPVPVTLWNTYKSEDDGKDAMLPALTRILTMAHDAKLHTLLQLVVLDSDSSDTDDDASPLHELVTHALDYAVLASVDAVQLPTQSSLSHAQASLAASSSPSSVALLVPMSGHDLTTTTLQDDSDSDTSSSSDSVEDSETAVVFAAYSVIHDMTIADVASSTSDQDRVKLFYHESVACGQRTPLEFLACRSPYAKRPAMVVAGFDLAIDDCAHATHHDYGQCGRFDETVDSPWWRQHRQSLAARQMFAYEQGVGWTFAAWKVRTSNNQSGSRLSSPAELYSLRSVLAAGLMSDTWLLSTTGDNDISSYADDVQLACLNPPEPDFVLGDATLSPTPGPPPDCGEGWWNVTIQDCTYWVPPPPCPVCDDGSSNADNFTAPLSSTDPSKTGSSSLNQELRMAPSIPILASSFTDSANNTSNLMLAAMIGGLVVLLVGAAILRLKGGLRSNYQPIPS